jgi:mono/diheme cytochrome c family protein
MLPALPAPAAAPRVDEPAAAPVAMPHCPGKTAATLRQWIAAVAICLATVVAGGATCLMVFGQPAGAANLTGGSAGSEAPVDHQQAAAATQDDESDAEATATGDAAGAVPVAQQDGIDAAGAGADQAGAALAQQARAILENYCHRCHGAGGSNEGGFNFVLHRSKLIESDAYIAPGKPDDSYLYQRMAAGDMPPRGEEPRPSGEQIEIVRRWIAAGAPEFAAAAPRDFVTNEQIAAAMRADLQQVAAREQKFVRYFTITNLYNAGFSEDELQTYRLALVKLLNSLSWNRNLVPLRPIDPQQTMFRIDLRDFDWNESIWNAIVDNNPYSVILPSADAIAVQQATGTLVPLVRGDWFVFAASKPPLYHKVLQLPDSLQGLETLLRVDVAGNIARERVARAGFNRSGVSQNNRMIERHESPYGALWVSYDFAGNTGRKNLFEHPMGPGDRSTHFEHDGGEVIFNLPNGLQGYMLVDGQGKRIDRGPLEIVSDPRRPDRTVTNGISCMSCHYAGIINKSDEVREHVLANRRAFPDADDILSLYPDNGTMARLQTADAERFQEALRQLGIPRISETGEPIVNMSLRFESNLDLQQAAAEFGLRPLEFRTRLTTATPDLIRKLGVLVAGGTIKREVFAQEFARATEQLGLGRVPQALDARRSFATQPAATQPQPSGNGAAPQAVAAQQPTAAAPATDVVSDAAGHPADLPPDAAPQLAGAVRPDLQLHTKYRNWRRADGVPVFAAEFLGLQRGVLRLRFTNGQQVYLPLHFFSQLDQQYVQHKVGAAYYENHAQLPPGTVADIDLDDHWRAYY